MTNLHVGLRQAAADPRCCRVICWTRPRFRLAGAQNPEMEKKRGEGEERRGEEGRGVSGSNGTLNRRGL